jgi:hypothetical protein
MERRCINHKRSFEEAQAAEARRLREQAKRLPHGGERDGLIRRARQAGSHINAWLTCLGTPK